mgnify:CR=1 FL=1
MDLMNRTVALLAIALAIGLPSLLSGRSPTSDLVAQLRLPPTIKRTIYRPSYNPQHRGSGRRFLLIMTSDLV